MSAEILNERDFKTAVCEWLIKYDRCFIYSRDDSIYDIAEDYRLPDIDYEHTQSQMNENGNLVTLLKGKIMLSAAQSRCYGKELSFVFHKVLETPTDTPEVEPFPAGYIIYNIDDPDKSRKINIKRE